MQRFDVDIMPGLAFAYSFQHYGIIFVAHTSYYCDERTVGFRFASHLPLVLFFNWNSPTERANVIHKQLSKLQSVSAEEIRALPRSEAEAFQELLAIVSSNAVWFLAMQAYPASETGDSGEEALLRSLEPLIKLLGPSIWRSLMLRSADIRDLLADLIIAALFSDLRCFLRDSNSRPTMLACNMIRYCLKTELQESKLGSHLMMTTFASWPLFDILLHNLMNFLVVLYRHACASATEGTHLATVTPTYGLIHSGAWRDVFIVLDTLYMLCFSDETVLTFMVCLDCGFTLLTG